ncbi:MAG: YbjN domain-containing protein [Faecalibacterium sp.]|nr:YbjN domain-containing protein [Ruminococcus sp.]MCM1392578.1 YbjN domain-containing protein [Ruminococcus sp.]MCM1485780.1 YbjN domain-containing protein [Faecalibacterium sp.]
MADEMNKINARKVYNTLCETLDYLEWTGNRDDEKLTVSCKVSGEDLPIDLLIMIDDDRELIKLWSFMPFKMSEEKLMDGAIATCAASYGLAEGSFDYDISNGSIMFRIVSSFKDSNIGKGLLLHMIVCAMAMVDKYNDKFFALNKGMIGIDEFIK